MKVGAKILNAVEDRVVRWAADTTDAVVDLLMSDGYPYGTEPLADRDLYNRLVALKMLPGSEFWTDPAAQVRLAQLEQRFGPAPIEASMPGAPFLSGAPQPPGGMAR